MNLLTISFLFVVGVTQGQDGYLTYVTGTSSNGIAAADINGDGKLDLVVASSSPNTLITLLNDGKGGFTPQIPFSLGQLMPRQVVTADFNGDHKIDVVVLGTGATGVAVLLGNGDGTFQPALPVSGCSKPTSAQVADLNGDGIPDLAVTCLNGGFPLPTGAYFLVLPGKGDGTFGAGTGYSLGFTPWALLTIGDFNRDGKPDVAIATERTVTILLNDGKANFNPVTSSSEPWDFVPGIAAGDFNGDGALDLAVTAQLLSGGGRGTITILLGKGDGTFQIAGHLETAGFDHIAAMDLNGDGHIDLVEGLASLVFFAGRGDGTFEGGLPFSASGNTGNFALADFRGAGVTGFAGTQGNGTTVILTRPAWPSLALANVSAAGYGLGPLAPGSIVTAFGTNLATQTAQASGTLPFSLGGAAVSVTDSAGAVRLAQLYYVSPAQVNYVIPSATVPGSASVSITADGHVTATDRIEVTMVAPALFTVNRDNLAAANVLRVSQNGDRTFETIYYTDQNGNITALPIDFGADTDSVYLILYGTGIRNLRNPSSVSASIGGVITYAGAQGNYEGLDQVNLKLPRSLASPMARTVALQLMVDGQPSNRVTLLVQ